MKAAPEQYRITERVAATAPFDLSRLTSDSTYGNNGAFFLPRAGKKLGYYFLCIVSDGEGWEHVSVSITTEKRSPTWEEMCYIKGVFWGPEETVIQYHPPESSYVNNHPFCLHLWRSTRYEIPVPDPKYVGIK